MEEKKKKAPSKKSPKKSKVKTVSLPTKEVEKRAEREAEAWAQQLTDDADLSNIDAKIEALEKELFGQQRRRRRKKKVKRESPQVEVLSHVHVDEETKEPVGFTFDMGSLDEEFEKLVKLLDDQYREPQVTADIPNTSSFYTTNKQGMDRLGLKIILNRMCVVLKYRMIASSETTELNSSPHTSRFTPDKYKDIEVPEGISKIIRRSNNVFSRQLGNISGCMVIYPSYIIFMLEGPEIAIADVFIQLYKSSLMSRITQGSILFIMPQIFIRYFPIWYETKVKPSMEIAIRKNEFQQHSSERIESNVKDPKTQIVNLGIKCRRLWRYIRSLLQEGKLDEIEIQNVPEEDLLETVMNCSTLRPLHTWLEELIGIAYKNPGRYVKVLSRCK